MMNVENEWWTLLVFVPPSIYVFSKHAPVIVLANCILGPWRCFLKGNYHRPSQMERRTWEGKGKPGNSETTRYAAWRDEETCHSHIWIRILIGVFVNHSICLCVRWLVTRRTVWASLVYTSRKDLGNSETTRYACCMMRWKPMPFTHLNCLNMHLDCTQNVSRRTKTRVSICRLGILMLDALKILSAAFFMAGVYHVCRCRAHPVWAFQERAACFPISGNREVWSADRTVWPKRCWLLIAGCWLLVADCWLLIADCWLLIADCWLLIADCLSMVDGWLLIAD